MRIFFPNFYAEFLQVSSSTLKFRWINWQNPLFLAHQYFFKYHEHNLYTVELFSII